MWLKLRSSSPCLVAAGVATVVLAGGPGAVAQAVPPTTGRGTPRVLPDSAWAAERAKRARVDGLISTALASEARRDYASAEALIRQALGIDRHNPLAWLRLAQVCERRGEHSSELAAYRELIFPRNWSSSVGSDPYTKMAYVLALARAGKWGEADAMYRATLGYEGAVRGAEEAVRHGAPSMRVLSTLRRPLAPPPPTLGPVDRDALLAAAHFYMGAHGPTYWEPDAYTKMMGHLRAAIKLRPQWAEAHFKYASLLFHRGGDRVEVLKEFDRAAAFGDAAMKQKVERASRGLRYWWRYHSRGLPVPGTPRATSIPR